MPGSASAGTSMPAFPSAAWRRTVPAPAEKTLFVPDPGAGYFGARRTMSPDGLGLVPAACSFVAASLCPTLHKTVRSSPFDGLRSEEHTSELPSLMRHSY